MAKNGDNFLNHWGNSDWEKTLYYKGSEQLGKSVRFLQNYRWWEMQTDFTSTSPTWTEKHPMFPLAARINDILFVYVPNVRIINFQLKLRDDIKAIKVTGFIPETMQETPFTIKDNHISIPSNITTDYLIVISKQK